MTAATQQPKSIKKVEEGVEFRNDQSDHWTAVLTGQVKHYSLYPYTVKLLQTENPKTTFLL